MIWFDSNIFGESITAPHIRLPPLQDAIITKLWKATKACRENKDEAGLLTPGDVLIVLDGGRKQPSSVLSLFNMTKTRTQADKGRKNKDGKTVAREIVMHFTEESVKARKFRKKTKNDLLPCTQKAHVFYNGTTVMSPRPHKHFPGSTNLSNTLGPVALPAFKALPLLTAGEKKEFWGARRRAVGGPTGEDDDGEEGEDEEFSEGEDDEAPAVEDIDQMQEVTLETPAVGGGRGSKGLSGDHAIQPVCWHQLPTLVAESLCHAFWAMAVIDLTPGVGELCINSILSQTAYLGVCHSEYQRSLILARLKQAVLQGMKNPDSKLYSPAFAKDRFSGSPV